MWQGGAVVRAPASFVAHGAQHIGEREAQHDSLRFEASGPLVVADGNGRFGDCSQRVIELFCDHLADGLQRGLEVDEAADRAVRFADDALCVYLDAEVEAYLDRQMAEPRMRDEIEMLGRGFHRDQLGSGSTLLALLDAPEGALLVHVGDSRAYHVVPASRSLAPLTTDHVWTDGDDTEDIDGTIYNFGLAISRALGHPMMKRRGVLSSRPDLIRLPPLGPGEAYLLCSDGLCPVLEAPAEIDAVFALLARPASLATAAEALIARAATVASDNVSLILVRPGAGT